MPTVKVSTNIAATAKRLDKNVIRQMPFIKSLAVNRTLKIIKEGTIQVMKQRFDRPTKYTLDSLRIIASSKKQVDPEGKVYFKDDESKGTPAVNYLSPGFYGGPRRHKRFEKALIAKGLMTADMYAMPGAGARLDAHGNMRRSQIVQILSALRAFGEQGYLANRSASKRSQKKVANSNYFVLAGDSAGVYKREKQGPPTPIMSFGKAPRYRVTIPFEKIAENMAKKHLPEQFNKAFDDAMKTSR